MSPPFSFALQTASLECGPSMADTLTIAVISDIHYAGEAERKRGGTELEVVRNPLLKAGVFLFRRFVWLKDPTAQNHMLDRAIQAAKEADFVVANGDYSCDTAFVGVSDDAAFESAENCLTRLREASGDRLLITMGDHEIGKMSIFGGVGGPRLESWERVRHDLEIEPLWTRQLGSYLLVGIASPVVAFPAYEPEAKPEERPIWWRIRDNYMRELSALFSGLHPKQRVILFCHDPTALPFLHDQKAIRERIHQIETTVVGHLHTPMIYGVSRLLAGMPQIDLLGNTVRRHSEALNKADCWPLFKPQLCPSPSGSQLLKDGGICKLTLDMEGTDPVRARVMRLPTGPNEALQS